MLRTISLRHARCLRPVHMRAGPLAMVATLALSGCGGVGSDSGLNPFKWFGASGRTAPASLAPKGGYAEADLRQPVANLLSARWEPLSEGRLLVVTGLASSSGWWDVALVPETAQPAGRLRADADGILRLHLVGNPPPADSVAARTPALPGRDTLTAALALNHAVLDSATQVVVSGAGNAVTLRR